MCLTHLEMPVYLKCGFVCCRRCIHSLQREPGGEGVSCPSCSVVSQKKDLRPGTHLGRLVSRIKELEPQLRAVLQMNPEMRKFQGTAPPRPLKSPVKGNLPTSPVGRGGGMSRNADLRAAVVLTWKYRSEPSPRKSASVPDLHLREIIPDSLTTRVRVSYPSSAARLTCSSQDARLPGAGPGPCSFWRCPGSAPMGPEELWGPWCERGVNSVLWWALRSSVTVKDRGCFVF